MDKKGEIGKMGKIGDISKRVPTHSNPPKKYTEKKDGKRVPDGKKMGKEDKREIEERC